MRTEELTAKALENLNFDKYLLANAVGKRAEKLANGASLAAFFSLFCFG